MWAPWVAPCPIPGNALRGLTVHKRRTKERMDDRTRLRQPLLPTLVAHLEDRYHHLRVLLQQASPLAAGEVFILEDLSYRRSWSPADDKRQRRGGDANVRVRDLTSEKDVNVTTAEELAFWEWAAVEALRHSGIRIEELLELTHLSIRQYRRPNGEVTALLVIAPSKTDRERVIPMSAELFAVIAAIIRRHLPQGRTIPLLPALRPPRARDGASRCRSCSSAQLGTDSRGLSHPPPSGHAARRCGDLAGDHPEFSTAELHPARLPEDLRHRAGQQRAAHPHRRRPARAPEPCKRPAVTSRSSTKTSYAITRHSSTGGASRARPMSTGRPPTPSGPSSRNTSTSARSNSAPAAAPTAPLPARTRLHQMPVLQVDPKMLARLDEIEADLLTRRERAQAEGWLGEIEGIDLTLDFLRQKRDETRRLARIAPVELGMPSTR